MWAKILAGLGGGITIITAVGFAVDAYEDMKQFGGRIERFENSVLSLEESLGHRIEEVRGIAESADQSPESQDAIKISHMITRELDAAKKDLRRNINLDEIEGRISSVENRLRELEAEIFNKIEIESEKNEKFSRQLRRKSY